MDWQIGRTMDLPTHGLQWVPLVSNADATAYTWEFHCHGTPSDKETPLPRNGNSKWANQASAATWKCHQVTPSDRKVTRSDPKVTPSDRILGMLDVENYSIS